MNIDRFIELNKAWLDKFEYNDYDNIGEINPAWWNGNVSYNARGDGISVLGDRADNYLWVAVGLPFEDKDIVSNVDGELYFIDNEYFLNWKQPTKEEMDYYELVNGYRLPWSEEEPFIWED